MEKAFNPKTLKKNLMEARGVTYDVKFIMRLPSINTTTFC